jgi:3-oxoacyl-[acyl-carrier-protein] synthase III
MIAVATAAWYLPPTSVAVADLPELATLSDQERTTCLALGIDRVPVDDTLGTVDLAARAGQRALANAGLQPTDVDVLLTMESRAPETLISSEPTRLQAILGLNHAMAFSVGGLGCASITPALLTAQGLLHTNPHITNILVLHGSKPATPHRYRHPVTVNGDSGGVLLLSRHGPIHIRDILLETNGKYANLFQIAYRNTVFDQWREECTDLPTYSFHLAIETRNRLRALNTQILTRNNLHQNDISCYLTQNLSLSAFHTYEEALNIRIAKPCHDNLAQHGHLGPNDVFLNLFSALHQGHLTTPDRAILLNVSPSAAWSALLIETAAAPGTSHQL